MQKLAVLILASLMSANASAINWVFVSGASGFSSYVDSDSIANTGKYKIAFVKSIYDSPSFLNSSLLIDQSMALIRYNCNSYPAKFQVLSLNNYKDNKLVVSTSYNENVNWIVIYPDTIADLQAKLVCQ